ncbi:MULTISPECIES: hypothetical protein [unclassified Paenibacillus]|uniref:hypothetical protein n=1 Tax=unclassified Paenibacillus TaxID=185978 RepID=UPI001AEADAD3|nr:MULTISPECIES: hypothetical protein [unclassified Paenibacillus]MBP1156969.1 hypothetical protein [Paenibacillus sp. PvP091]MBP1172292.1 hypothetical protein [Paenibacillus sp. PvR098]MBP2438673.1 hypothetical protein [Paenibacillus sp. PvP052]
MPLYIYYIIFLTIMLFGTIATIMIGLSKKNREGNPGYDQKTSSIFKNLSYYYIIAIVLGYLALVLYIVK